MHYLFALILECIVTCTSNCLKPTHFEVQDNSLCVVPCAYIAVNHVKYNNFCYLNIFEIVGYKLFFLQIQKENHVDTISFFPALLRFIILNIPLNIFVLVFCVLN